MMIKERGGRLSDNKEMDNQRHIVRVDKVHELSSSELLAAARAATAGCKSLLGDQRHRAPPKRARIASCGLVLITVMGCKLRGVIVIVTGTASSFLFS